MLEIWSGASDMAELWKLGFGSLFKRRDFENLSGKWRRSARLPPRHQKGESCHRKTREKVQIELSGY